MAKFHQAPLGNDWSYLMLDAVWLKVQRPFGPRKVLRLVVHGVRIGCRGRLLRSGPSIRERVTSVAECKRCGICAKRWADEITTQTGRMPNASIKPSLGERLSGF